MIQGTLHELCPRLHKSLGRAAAAASSSSPAFFYYDYGLQLGRESLLCRTHHCKMHHRTLSLSACNFSAEEERETDEWANPFSFFLEIISLLSLILFTTLKEFQQYSAATPRV
jgi:hypothetical protein